MELKLISKREIKDVIYLKKYEYGNFKIKVEVNPNGTYKITATDKLEEIRIESMSHYQALISIQINIHSKEELDEFMLKLKEAEDIKDILDNHYEEMIR